MVSLLVSGPYPGDHFSLKVSFVRSRKIIGA